MRLGLRLKGETIQELTQWAQRAEQAGFDTLWAQELYTTPFVYPAAVASATSRITLGSSIVLAFVRSPLATALAALDLDRLTNGRYVLGLGTGVQRLNERWHGVQDYGRPAPHLKETIRAVRMLLDDLTTGEPIRFRGEYYDLDIQGFSVGLRRGSARVPIYAAAIQEGMVRNMAEVADGILGQAMVSYKWVNDKWLPQVKVGLDRAGRRRDDIKLCVSVSLAISNDVRAARYALAKTVAFYCTVGTYQPLFAHYGFAREQAAIREQFRKHGGHGPHCFDLVTDEMVDAFFVAGTPDDARRLVARYEGLVDEVILTPPGYYVSHDELAEYQRAIMETFAR